MALVISDRVKETTTTTGVGSLVLLGASTGFQSFESGVGNANTTYYSITDGTDWEVGIGTYTTGPATMARSTILDSSNAGSAVAFSAGSKDVFSTGPAAKLCMLSDEGSLGIGTTAPQTIASWGSGSTRTWVNINNSSTECGFVAEGNIASLNLIDSGAVADDQWYRVYVDGGLIRHGSTLDSGSARNTNIFTMDMGNENIGFGAVPDTTSRFYVWSDDEDCVWEADAARNATDELLYRVNASWSGTPVARINWYTGDDTSNLDDGYLTFDTAEGGVLSEAFRIEQNGESIFKKAASFDYYDNGNSGASDTIDWGLSNYQKSTLSSAAVTYTFTDPVNAEVGSFSLVLHQDATGGRTGNWPSVVSWGDNGAPTLTATASGVDVLCFLFASGTYYGSYSLGHV